MKAPYSYVPALPPLAGLIAGIIAWQLDAGISGIIIAIALFLLLYSAKRHYYSFVALFAAIGMIMSMAHQPPVLPQWVQTGSHTFTAKIQTAQESDNSIVYTAKVTSIDGCRCTAIPTRLTVRSVQDPAEPGSTVRFTGTLTSTSDAVTTDLPHEIDYNKYLKAEGIEAIAAVDATQLTSAPSSTQTYINNIRNDLYNAIVFSPVDGPTASFLLATILGDDSYIAQSKYDQYRSIGIAHILALSGMHVGIIVSMVSLMLFPLVALRRGRPLRSIITLLIIWAYAVIVGFTPSIVRAAVMITVFIAARHIQRGYMAFNSLFVSVIIILCINPMWLLSPGFQLSVAAVGSILAFGNIVPKQLKRRPIAYYTLNMLVIPVAAMLGTGIVGAYHFHSLAGMFLLGNVVTGLLFPLILFGGILTMSCTMAGYACVPLGMAISWLYRVMDISVEWIAAFTWAEARGIYFSAWVILPYALMLVALAFAIRRRNASLWLTVAILCATTIIAEQLTKERIPTYEIYVPHSAQSTDIIIRDGREALLLAIDGDGDERQHDCEHKYRGFLHSRRCDNRFSIVDAPLSTRHCRITDRAITYGGQAIAIASDSLIVVPANTPVQYLIFTRSYSADILDAVRAAKPDTVVIGAMHPSHRKKIMSRLGDSIPAIDLRRRGIKIAAVETK